MVGEPIQRVLLNVDIFHLLLFDDVSLVQHLDGILSAVVSIGRSQDGTVRALSKSLAKIEVLHALFDGSGGHRAIWRDFSSDTNSGSALLPILRAGQWTVVEVVRRTR